ncbi:hypothetical protein [Bradyrhizobium australafricanum]|uniref:hypothetical protein n=1 Tax=Bradyrhizobium australafricanum TaxID=2821406 RepID=UPI001CE27E41|nr:hypothetical protein [Bradyrhizobium australafricanum]MCA6102813.1 hypothetical protein [Bradyrhizobium australafricanum]
MPSDALKAIALNYTLKRGKDPSPTDYKDLKKPHDKTVQTTANACGQRGTSCTPAEVGDLSRRSLGTERDMPLHPSWTNIATRLALLGTPFRAASLGR